MISINENSMKFWGAVAVGVAIKLVLTDEPQTKKKAAAGIICGAAAAFYGTDAVVAYFSISEGLHELVTIGLVITGEHITRSIVEKTPQIINDFIESKRKS